MQTVGSITWRIMLVAAACASFYLAFPGEARACSCFRSESVAEALAASDKVFSGRVTSIAELPSDRFAVQFQAMDVWKGPVAESIRVEEPSLNNSCHYGFKPGAEYLVYSSSGEVNYCTRTKFLSQAQLDLDELGGPQAIVATRRASGAPATPGEPASGAGCAASTGAGGMWLALVGGLGLLAVRRRTAC